MRLVSLIVALCFSANVLASSGTAQELERLMDDYHYSISVDWDQKDQTFYESKTQEFYLALQNLMATSGLSKEQMISIIEKKVNNKALVDAIVLKMGLLSKEASPEEFASLVKETANDMYAQGASWNGSAIVPVIGLVLVGAIGYVIYWSLSRECVRTESRYVCNTYNYCTSGGGYYNGGDFYRFCTGYSSTTCGYQNVCVEYVKK